MNEPPLDMRGKTAPVEFVAPYALPDCVLRLRDTRVQQASFMSPGIDPTFEKVSPGVYHFTIRRTWYDTRYRRQSSYLELRGYLKGLDERSTVVVASLHTSWYVWLIPLLFVPLVIGVILDHRDPRAVIWVLVVAVIALLLFGLLLYSDRRTLFRVVRRALSDESIS